jgi:hypothetical protein
VRVRFQVWVSRLGLGLGLGFELVCRIRVSTRCVGEISVDVCIHPLFLSLQPVISLPLP